MTDRDIAEIHESYRHFRNSAIALSVTVIAVSGAMLLRLEQMLSSNSSIAYRPVSLAFTIVFVVCILEALVLQYRHFEGYRDFAHSQDAWDSGNRMSRSNPHRTQKWMEAETLRISSNSHFTKVEKIAGRLLSHCVYGIAGFYSWSLTAIVVTSF